MRTSRPWSFAQSRTHCNAPSVSLGRTDRYEAKIHTFYFFERDFFALPCDVKKDGLKKDFRLTVRFRSCVFTPAASDEFDVEGPSDDSPYFVCEKNCGAPSSFSFLQLRHWHRSDEQAAPARKHTQYFFRQFELTQRHPRRSFVSNAKESRLRIFCIALARELVCCSVFLHCLRSQRQYA